MYLTSFYKSIAAINSIEEINYSNNNSNNQIYILQVTTNLSLVRQTYQCFSSRYTYDRSLIDKYIHMALSRFQKGAKTSQKWEDKPNHPQKWTQRRTTEIADKVLLQRRSASSSLESARCPQPGSKIFQKVHADLFRKGKSACRMGSHWREKLHLDKN